MNYSAKLFDCRTIYCTHYYHHHPRPHSAITSDTVRTPYSWRTHNIRISSLAYHLDMLFSYQLYCLFASSCWPAFCHAVINEYWLIYWPFVCPSVSLCPLPQTQKVHSRAMAALGGDQMLEVKPLVVERSTEVVESSMKWSPTSLWPLSESLIRNSSPFCYQNDAPFYL